MKKIVLLLILLALVWQPLSLAQAKGGELITVSGPAMFGPIETNNLDITLALSTTVFEDLERPIDPPTDLTFLFLVTRSYPRADSYEPFDQVIYVPNLDGGPGAVYYLGIVNGSGPHDGKWYQASARGEAAMKRLFEENGVRLDLALPGYSSEPVEAAARFQFPFDARQSLVAVLLTLSGIGLGWVLGTRRVESMLKRGA